MSDVPTAPVIGDPGAPYSSPAAFDPPPETSWGKLLRLVPEGSRVLDVGCAFGAFSSAMKRLRGCQVTGIEINAEAAAVARNHCDQVIEGDVTALADTLPSDFDVVVAADVLEHLVDPGATLRVLSRHLKPGGILLASIPNVTHMSVVLAVAAGQFPRSREGLLDDTHLRFFGEAEVLTLFHDAGYAARIADTVRIDPRLTEFHSDLAALAQPVVEFLSQNPNADTYQFIVRAVPRAWAAATDDQAAAVTPAPAPTAASIRAEIDQLHDRLGKYHEALSATQAREKALTATLREVEGGLRRSEDAREASGEKRSAQRLCGIGPLSPDQIARVRVLFVTARDDAPYRYRCVNACRQLRAAGAVANIAHVDDPALAEAVAHYSIVILFRLPWCDATARVFDAARASGASIGFDVDDLVFVPEAESWMPFVRRGTSDELAAYRRDIAALASTAGRVDFCLAATPTIARHARKRVPCAIVHPNLLSDEYVALSRIVGPLRRRVLRAPLFGYLSGSNTHDGDLESIGDALGAVLGRHPEARLLICGHASVPAALRGLGSRVIQVPYQDYRVYPWLLSRCSAALAPLEQINDFFDAKSALKVFEAGIFGVPAIASPSVQYAESIEDRVSGLLAATPAAWEKALDELCGRDAALAMGTQARRAALREYSPDAYRHVLARRLLAVAGKAARPEVPRQKPLRFVADWKDGLSVAERALRLGALRESVPERKGAAQLIPADGPMAAAASLWVSAARREGSELFLSSGSFGHVLADRERPISSWSAEEAFTLDAAAKGCRFEALGRDPRFLLEKAPRFASPPRLLVAQIRARTTAGWAMAQLFWSEPGGGIDEAKSLAFRIEADGEPHSYLLDLGDGASGLVPAVPGSLRFDPLDRTGEFEVTQLALLHAPVPAGLPDVRREVAARMLAGEGIEIGALQNPLALPARARVRYVDRLPLAKLRAQYPELADAQVVDPSIIAPAEDLRPIATGSQDFVVCNHVLEHMREPLGALREWTRVLKCGGRLYVSIPSRENPHDRARPLTTFAHLLEDERGKGRKGAPEDRAAYREWVDSVHGARLSPDERAAFAERLVEQDYSIHFHVFDRGLFERVLDAACASGAARLIELVEVPLGEYREFIAIVEKEEQRAPDRGVDVIVPIYNARDLTRRCVESVLRHVGGDVRVVLVDDASPDPGIQQDLQAFAASDPRVIVLTNEKNLGFVGTCNRAMRHAAGRDVLLLNSDTEVFVGFLDRLRAAAAHGGDTGIVTPFSNSATIYSIPEFGDNDIPEGHTPGSMALLVAALSRGTRPEMPTAVGFCMYVRAEVLERVGDFDEETFGRGFGEEDDLCLRARKAGFKVRLCDDVFVWHKGKASFGAEGKKLEGRNGERLRRKHPEYGSEIAHFFRTNPLARLQREIRFHIPRLREGARGAALFLLHASPFSPSAGGTEHHVRDLLRALRLPRAVVAYPHGAALVAMEVLDGGVESAISYRFDLSRLPEQFAVDDPEVERLIRRWVPLFGIRWAHIHHLMFWPMSLGATLAELGVPFLFTAHDFYAVCPSWNLFDHARGEKCPCPDPAVDPEGCVRAHLAKTQSSPPPLMDVAQLRRGHRAASLATLGAAKAIVAPSAAVRDRLIAHLGLQAEKCHVIEHGYDADPPTQRAPPGERLRLAVLGEVAYPHKGARSYRELIEATRNLPVEWHFYGNAERFQFAEGLRSLGLGERLQFHGAYDRAGIVGRLAEAGIDLAVMLPECDETFSFTLSEALIAGVPAIVSESGALPGRVNRTGAGVVVRSVAEARAVLERFCSDRAAVQALAERARAFRHQTVLENAERYRELYASLGFGTRLDAELRPDALRELSDRAGIHPLAAPQSPQRELPRALQRVEKLLPARARKIGARVLKRIAERPLMVLTGGRAAATVGLRLLERNGATLKYEVDSADPQLVFNVGRVPASRVNEFRFRLRRPVAGIAYAQLFWASDRQPGFTEERSAVVLLDAKAGEWRDYVLRLDSSDVAPRWRCGNVRQLRFDPTDQPGVIELGRIELR